MSEQQSQGSSIGKRGLTLIACAALVAVMAVAGIALAHTKRIGTNLAFTYAKNYGGPGSNLALAKGKVHSALAKCRQGREVQVFRVAQPNDVFLKRTFSATSGRWKAKIPRPSNGQKLYAVVEAKAFGPAGHNHYCAEDFSPVRTYPYP